MPVKRFVRPANEEGDKAPLAIIVDFDEREVLLCTSIETAKEGLQQMLEGGTDVANGDYRVFEIIREHRVGHVGVTLTEKKLGKPEIGGR